MRTSSAFMVALLLALPAHSGGPDASVPVTPPAQACLSAAQLEERARTVLRESEALSTQPYLGPLSPPLPATWPPAGEPVVRLYAFRSQPLPTGIIAYRDWSPHGAAQVALRGEAPPRLQRLKARGLGRREERVAEPSRASIEQATEVLLQSLCRSSLPTSAEAETLRAGYLAWLDTQPLIARELRTHAPAFFTWLDAKASDER